jgi:hypothetical protein
MGRDAGPPVFTGRLLQVRIGAVTCLLPVVCRVLPHQCVHHNDDHCPNHKHDAARGAHTADRAADDRPRVGACAAGRAVHGGGCRRRRRGGCSWWRWRGCGSTSHPRDGLLSSAAAPGRVQAALRHPRIHSQTATRGTSLCRLGLPCVGRRRRCHRRRHRHRCHDRASLCAQNVLMEVMELVECIYHQSRVPDALVCRAMLDALGSSVALTYAACRDTWVVACCCHPHTMRAVYVVAASSPSRMLYAHWRSGRWTWTHNSCSS